MTAPSSRTGATDREVGDVRPTDHELSTGHHWAWSVPAPPQTPRELADLIATALAHERERLAYLAARAAAAPAVPTDVVDQVAQAMCRADAVNKGRSFDEAVAPGVSLWMRYRYEAEQLVGELPWLRTAALLAEQPGGGR